jgi:hypothetical protein
MANTSALKLITEYAIHEVSKDLAVELITEKVPIGNQGITKKYDGVSHNRDVIVKVINHSGYTSGGKLPVGKIRNTFAECYFLTLTNAKTKILAITNADFFEIFKSSSKGLLGDIKLVYIDLPNYLKEIAREVSHDASVEMS